MLHMAALMNNTGTLLALDVDAGRLERVREREARAGVTIGRVCLPHEDEATLRTWEGRADRVLIDAPCTGFGTVRRNPWLKSNVDEEDVDRLSHVQHGVLDRYARLVKPGGRLVYATCTLLEKENEHAVEWFLSTHPQFLLLSAPDLIRTHGVLLESPSPYLSLLPSETGTDGFFAAALVRND
jgi:16S rRNA (cytosine967-C5)-methyltransferase